MSKENRPTQNLDGRRLALVPGWKLVALIGMVIVFSTLQAHAQIKVRPEVGPNGSPNCGDAGVCAPMRGDVPPLMKPALPDDEKCLPWNLSAAPATTFSVTTLKVPSKARGEYEKACNASFKKKFDDAERYSRLAIEKFQDYAAAWVMLGVVLDQQHKEQEARDACSRATSIDGKYLPAYLCMAEFSARNREWEKLLTLANAALGLNSENAGYAYYYRAMAYLHLHNPMEAQKSALEAVQADVNHNYVPLYFLLAEAYDAGGDKPAAEAQLRQILKHHLTREQEDAVKKYLATLEAPPAAPTEKSAAPGNGAGSEAATEELDDSAFASLAELRKVNGSWIPEDVDDAVPPVAAGVACSLPVVLDGAGQRITELIHNVDRFTATENLTHQVIDRSGRMEPPATAQFNYLVSYSEDGTGYLKVNEFRNAGLSPEEAFPNHIATIGTPSLVLIFHPRNVANFKMECEGLGRWHGQPAWQVRFEQRADRPNLTYSFTVDRVDYGVGLRGRAWILADSFQVARLETDLEQAVPKIRLRLDHQSVEYRPVESAASHLQLWLPSSTELFMDFQGRRFYRKHSFSDFQLFSVDTQYKVNDPKESNTQSPPAGGTSDNR